MQLNQLFSFTLFVTLLGIPVGGILLSEPAIAQQRSNLNFQNIQFSSAGLSTASSGTAMTTVIMYVQNYGVNQRSLYCRRAKGSLFDQDGGHKK